MIDPVLLTTALIRVSLWLTVAIFAYRRRRPVACIGFTLLVVNAAVFGWQRSGGDIGEQLVSITDALATFAVAAAALGYILADPRERDSWREEVRSWRR